MLRNARRMEGQILRWLALAGSLLLCACGGRLVQPAAVLPSPAGTVVEQADIFTVSGPAGERQAVLDVAQALKSRAGQIRRDLDFDYRSPVQVEIFADQESLDREGMNPDMQGYYAYSGKQRIQMVSPRNAMPGLDIPYSARVDIAVHEFAHIVIGAINPQAPLWLNEGAAVYAAPHAVYAYVCQNQFPFAQIPAFAEMEDRYQAVPAADLFAYSAVDFIVSTHGQETLNKLIRSPERFEELLGVSRSQFDQDWRAYMEAHYASK